MGIKTGLTLVGPIFLILVGPILVARRSKETDALGPRALTLVGPGQYNPP
jgi:hypothetical protein